MESRAGIIQKQLCLTVDPRLHQRDLEGKSNGSSSIQNIFPSQSTMSTNDGCSRSEYPASHHLQCFSIHSDSDSHHSNGIICGSYCRSYSPSVGSPWEMGNNSRETSKCKRSNNCSTGIQPITEQSLLRVQPVLLSRHEASCSGSKGYAQEDLGNSGAIKSSYPSTGIRFLCRDDTGRNGNYSSRSIRRSNNVLHVQSSRYEPYPKYPSDFPVPLLSQNGAMWQLPSSSHTSEQTSPISQWKVHGDVTACDLSSRQSQYSEHSKAAMVTPVSVSSTFQPHWSKKNGIQSTRPLERKIDDSLDQSEAVQAQRNTFEGSSDLTSDLIVDLDFCTGNEFEDEMYFPESDPNGVPVDMECNDMTGPRLLAAVMTGKITLHDALAYEEARKTLKREKMTSEVRPC